MLSFLNYKMLIGLAGLAGSGKDTVAKFLTDYEKIAFADPLKESCKILFNLSDKQLSDRTLKETVDSRYGKSPRQLMQLVGTDILRRIDPDLFVERARERIEMIGGNVIISDVRFENECKMIKEKGGIIINIVRNIDLIESHKHESENQNIKKYFDYVIENDGTIEELEGKIRGIVG